MSDPGHAETTVAVFDLDGTLTHRDTYTGIMLHSLRFNRGNIPRLVPLSVPVVRFALGRLDNASLKAAFLKSLFAGLPADRLDAITRSFVDRLMARGLREQAVKTLERHRADGHETVLLTASLDFYVEDIARRLAVDHCICTRAARGPGGTLTGELASANCRGAEKLARLRAHFGDAPGGRCFVGYGDRESDFHLLTALNRGVVVSPGRRTRARAVAAGLQVVQW